MSAGQSDAPPPILEPEPKTLTVTVKSIEGLDFMTELGNQQIAVSILFPGHMNDSMSPLAPPESKITFDFTENYLINFYPQTTINALIQNPLEFYVYVCTQDMKRANQVCRFVFPFDQLLFNNSYAAVVDGTVLPDGATILPAEGLKATINFSWDQPLIQPEDIEDSLIATFNVSSFSALPQAMINCSTQPNNLSTHIFTYTSFAQLPDGQILLMDDGKFSATSSDGTDAVITFSNAQKFFINPEGFAKWKEAAENDEYVSIYLIPEMSPLLSPLGIQPAQYSALFAKADIPLNHFAKAGRSHFMSQIAVYHDATWSENDHPIPPLTPTGFPPEPQPDPAGKKKAPARKGNMSSRGSAKTKAIPSAAGKKAKALSAKDKKTLQIIQNVLNFDDSDVFQASTTQLKVELALSKPLIPRSTTPIVTKRPEEVIRPLPKVHGQRLADATAEFCRQLNIAIDQLQNSGDSPAIRAIIKEQIKPSIVSIVSQVFRKKPAPKVDLATTKPILEGMERPHDDDRNDEVPMSDYPSQSFLAELRSFLLLHLNKTVNTRFNLSYPHVMTAAPEMTIDHLTKRIKSQVYIKTDDVGLLHERRCELDPLNPQWPFEYALYLSDVGDSRCLEYFSRAISIDYGFKAAILGFCAQLTKGGNRSDALVLLDMLYGTTPEDPVVVVCLSVVYTLMESSKSDEFLAKISTMSQNMSVSPYLVAAAALIEVHDTFISEIVLGREQMQNGRTKELLVLLAKFNQMTGEFPRAQEYLKEVLEMDQEDLAVWRMLGDFQFACGMREKAMQSYTTLLTLSEEPDPEVCLRLALIKIGLGEYDKAYDLLMYCVQKTDSLFGWLALGVCCLRRGEFEDADAALAHANEMDRWLALTWGYCALLCAKTERFVEGEQALVFALQLGIADQRLIAELVGEYSDAPEREVMREVVAKLAAIPESECRGAFENAEHSAAPAATEEEENNEKM